MPSKILRLGFGLLAAVALGTCGVSAAEISNISTAPANNASGYDYIFNFVANGQRIVRDRTVSQNLHAVFFRTTASDTLIEYRFSNDNGNTWTSPQVIAQRTPPLVVLHPTIAVDPNPANPAVFIVYSEYHTGTQATRTWIRNGTNNGVTTAWAAENEISDNFNGGAYVLPTGGAIGDPGALDYYLHIANNGTLHLVWSYRNAGNSTIMHITSNGVNWTANPTQFNTISSGIDDERHPRLAEDPSGNVYLVYQAFKSGAGVWPFTDTQTVIFRRDAVTTGWAAQPGINPGAGFSAFFPDIAFDSQSNRHITYTLRNEGSGARSIQYQLNNNAPMLIANASGFEMGSKISITQFDVPVILYWDTTAAFTIASSSFLSKNKLSNATWSGPTVESPVNRRNGSIVPVVRNDLISSTWFSAGDFHTKFARQADIIEPYKPDEVTFAGFNLGLTATLVPTPPVACSGATQRIDASIIAIPPDATEVRFILSGLTNAMTAFGAATTATFLNVADGQTAQISVQARDAAGNISVASTSINIPIADVHTGCFPFTITRPPLPASWTACGGAIGSFLSVEWTDNNLTPAGGRIALFFDNDNNCANGVLNPGGGAVALATAINNLAANAATFNIPVTSPINSAMVDTSALPDPGNYFICGVLGSSIATINASSVAAFTKNTAVNSIPQIVMTNPTLTTSNITATFQYADTNPAPFNPLTVDLFIDADCTFANGAVIATTNAGIVRAGGPPNSGTFSPPAYSFLSIPSGSYCLGGVITDGACTAFDYFGPFQLNNPFLNSFGQQIYNFPNPFSPRGGGPYQSSTRIVINTATAHPIDFYVFDTHGKMVWRTQLAATAFPNFVWFGRDINNQILPNGVYIMKAVFTDTQEVLKGRMSILDR